MDLLIIRHGESEADLLDVHEGRADFELTPRGHRQAAAMAACVAGRWNVRKIYASPLRRAAQTARHLSEATGREIVFDDDLMEFNNGLLAGMPREEAARLYPEPEYLPPDQALYGQESRLEFRRRADRVLARILSENERDGDGVIAVVSHGGMINQLYRSVLGLPVDCGVRFATADTGIHLWRVRDGSVCVVHADLDSHAAGI